MHGSRVGEGEEIDRRVYLSLGANLGKRQMQIEQGIVSLEKGGFTVVCRSSFYETEPVDLADQPWFLNLVIAGETDLPPRDLLALCQQIETDAGRKRTVRFGPRTLDIDILLYKGHQIDEQDLEIPHPRMINRRFVLIPLLEIAPTMMAPDGRTRYADTLAGLDENKKVKKLKGNEF
jgi:2-amino-4-hydroxy-6-hydroxymethyldihydropteridine diphosphokinase